MLEERTFVYIMQSSNGLVKIGKTDDVERRRQELEQKANMFNTEAKITLKVVKFYPTFHKAYAFNLEALLHEYFSECLAGTSSKEVFRIHPNEVIYVADLFERAFSLAQTIELKDVLLRNKNDHPNNP
jgi:predicted GIY-YIG superfamily endonuclease